MNFIFIEGMQLEASVGVYAHEQLGPQKLLMDLRIGLRQTSFADDHIDATIDYARVVKRVRELSLTKHFNLLETLAEFLITELGREFKPRSVHIRLAKPAVLKDVAQVGVSIERIIE